MSNNLHPLFKAILKQQQDLVAIFGEQDSACDHEIAPPADRDFVRCTKCGALLHDDE